MTDTPTDRSTAPQRARPTTTQHQAPADDDAGRSGVARAGGRVTSPRRFDRAHVPPSERARLASSLGPVLLAARRRVRLSVRGLAEEAGCSPRTVLRLEHGEVRPRRSLLASLAEVLDPADAVGLTSRLCAAAGGSLRPDTTASLRARRRRARRGLLDYARAVRRHGELIDARVRVVCQPYDDAVTAALDRGGRDDATADDLAREAWALRQIAAGLDVVDALDQQGRVLAARIARRPVPP